MPSVAFRDVCLDLGSGPILSSVTATIDEHRVGIIGANGSGKSTLARMINGLATPTSGEVEVDGLSVRREGRRVRELVGFIFSDADNQIIMPSVRDDVAFSLRRRRDLAKKERLDLADRALAAMGLGGHEEQSPHVLSGGQKQLLALTSVLIAQPRLIVADEPTTLLDLRNRRRIRRRFAELEQQLIVVTHDLDLLDGFDRVLCIDRGRIVDDGPPDAVIPAYVERIEGERG
ncbi:energy-coupling factor ABC transporter ATP-binding protein [Corynebacterium mastitidis]|uniref:Cobalt ABC transporter ATP-binding protein n=1 Tax=Corynebacterium mastitidis TaxID=161890 RepID=A0A2N0X8R2_9CORY|nr:ABC transporter ATP-binding protein [Corynebacterium mastitidis]MCH6195918.1 energy-coupling factor ABC transporter ATP-binding protein [Corynebacterium mastitidis]PKF69067.1 cobalt ABC transporter ATP-binding protein [Corynebacterium mastitidis]